MRTSFSSDGGHAGAAQVFRDERGEVYAVFDASTVTPDGDRVGLYMESRASSPRIAFIDQGVVAALFDANGVVDHDAMSRVGKRIELSQSIGAITDDDVLVAMRAFKRGRNSGRKFSERMKAALHAFVGNHLAR